NCWRVPCGRRARRTRHERRLRGALHLHARGDRRPRDHLARARDPAHAADVRVQLHPRHCPDRRDGGARACGHDAREGDRFRRGAARRRQRGRRLRGDRADARHVQVQPQGGGRMTTALAWLPMLVKASYLVAATLFLLGLQRMASPKTARSGIRWAGAGMVLATAATFALPGLGNIGLIVLALAIGTLLAWVSGKRVAITDMPQMVALYNGMGGGSAAAIGAVEVLRYADAGARPPLVVVVLAVLGAL